MKLLTTRSWYYLEEPGHDFWKGKLPLSQKLFIRRFGHNKPSAIYFDYIQEKAAFGICGELFL